MKRTIKAPATGASGASDFDLAAAYKAYAHNWRKARQSKSEAQLSLDAAIGARVRAARKEIRPKVGCGELARAVGVDPSAMSRRESGKVSIGVRELRKIAEVLGKPPVYFVDGLA